MNKLFILGILFFVLFIESQPASAQFWAYEKFESSEGVEFYYKWVREERLDAESPKALSLKVKNTNDYRVSITFSLDYYWQGQRVGFSGQKEYCLLPKEMLIGRINDLLFTIEGYTNEQLESDDFTWELVDIKIEQVEECESLFINE